MAAVIGVVVFAKLWQVEFSNHESFFSVAAGRIQEKPKMNVYDCGILKLVWYKSKYIQPYFKSADE